MGYVTEDVCSKQPYGFLIRASIASKMLSRGLANSLTVKYGDSEIDSGIVKLNEASLSTSYLSGSAGLLIPILPLVDIWSSNPLEIKSEPLDTLSCNSPSMYNSDST